MDRSVNHSLLGNTSGEDTLLPVSSREKIEAEKIEADFFQNCVPENEAAKHESRKTRILIICFLLMLVIGSANRILSKLQTIPLQNYPITVNLLLSTVYCIFYSCYVIPTIYWGSAITIEERQISVSRFAVMGFLDAAASVMQSFSFNYITSGALLILLMQAAIPVSMLITKLWLKTKYKTYHYIGALVVLAGLVVVLWPKFSAAGGADGTGESMQLIWAAVLVFSCVPMALSAVYKEKVLATYNMNGLYLNGWVAVFQLIFSILLSLPAIYAQPQRTIGDLPLNIIDGLKCWVGQNSITVDVLNAAGKVIIGKDDCHMAPVYSSTYIAFNIGYNHNSFFFSTPWLHTVIVLILKFGSSNLLYLAMTAIVPLVDVAFSLNFMPNHESFTLYSVAGLVVILIGLAIYRFTGYLLDHLKARSV